VFGTGRSSYIEYDKDENFETLEPQLLRSNNRNLVNSILGKSFDTDGDLLKYMADNKTECALKFFETQLSWSVPNYIANAVYE